MAEAEAGAGSALVGMLNVFVDPAGTVKRVQAKLFWLWPLITLSIIYALFGYLMLPYTLQLIDARMSQQFSQQNVAPDRIERARQVAHTFAQFTFVVTPVSIIVLVVVMAWLVSATGSMVGLRAKFRDVFSLMAACSLIPALQYAATYIVLRVKNEEIQFQDQMTPPFGLDIFLQDVHGALGAVLNFFSIFEIWYLVILVFGLSYLGKCSKGQAFAAMTPAWVLPLLFRIVASMFGGASSS
ncbi:MAG TPA: YIP1 family protein [Bryobacteraceae bacterium]|nr:YIP1 family protein [Bryobacteraceae bacterium]